MRRTRISVFMLLSLLGQPVHAGEFSVSPAGDDAGPGSKSQPWKTIAKAVSTIQPGDTVILRQGIYRADKLHLGPAGKEEKSRTTFQAARGERVLFTGNDGSPPVFGLADHVRIEGIWLGGRWSKAPNASICALGGSPIGRGKELINCTIFGYSSGILLGSSEDLLIQGCRIVHCGMGRFHHGLYLSGGYTPGAMTQHVIVDDNTFVAGEGYAIHGWHKPHSCILTRNFVSGFFWDLVMDGSDHLIAHNTLWRNSGQPGREPGWNAWLPGERIVFANNILNSSLPLYGDPGPASLVTHNVFLSAAAHRLDRKPFSLRRHPSSLDARIQELDSAIRQIDAVFHQPVEKLFADQTVEEYLAVLRRPPPPDSGLRVAAEDVHLWGSDVRASPGRAVPCPVNFWKAFDKLGLRHFDKQGQMRKP